MRARTIFWGSVALLAHTHVTYPLALAAIERVRGRRDPAPPSPGYRPRVSLIIAAHDEEDVIAAKVADALAVEYPRELLELIVASDGSTDRTAEIAREAGADLVLELPRGGKLATQDAAVERASGELLAFSDANARWQPDALAELVAPFAEPDVGYVCGQVQFLDAEGDSEEGAYWRYEMWVRELESGLDGITAGNGGIYAVRADAYVPLPPSRSHDLSFPFEFRKRGLRSLYAPAARAEEKLVPTTEGEFHRKRRMMRGLWDIVVSDGMIDPRGYTPLYAFEIFSHRLLRYGSAKLHAWALLSNLVLLCRSPLYVLTLAVQLGVIASAFVREPRSRIVGLARYYALVTASIPLGVLDRFRDGPPAAWERSEGTR